MKSIALAAILTASIFATPAFAADLIPAPVVLAAPAYNWTGFYAGVNVGYGWGEINSGLLDIDTIDIEGITGGAQVGYNYDFGGFVLGAEADIQLADFESSETFGAVAATARLDYFGTIRARAGLAVDRFLPYVTGGLAYGQGSLDMADGFGLSLSGDNTHVGWTVGAGAEYAFTDNITVRGEYLYVDLNEENFFGNTRFDTNADWNFGVVRAGVNFKF